MTGQAPTPLRAAKAALRSEIIQRRDALGAGTRAAASARITEKIQALESYRCARCVLAYAGMGSEFDTAVLLSHIMVGKRLALPRVDRASRGLQLFFVTNLDADLQPGVWGIREPRPDHCVPAPLDEIDLVLAPGVAFTQHCERLGYGAGYYDRLIARFVPPVHRPLIVAAAFDIQVVAEVPLGVTDQLVDMVVTENTAYTC